MLQCWRLQLFIEKFFFTWAIVFSLWRLDRGKAATQSSITYLKTDGHFIVSCLFQGALEVNLDFRQNSNYCFDNKLFHASPKSRGVVPFFLKMLHHVADSSFAARHACTGMLSNKEYRSCECLESLLDWWKHLAYLPLNAHRCYCFCWASSWSGGRTGPEDCPCWGENRVLSTGARVLHDKSILLMAPGIWWGRIRADRIWSHPATEALLNIPATSELFSCDISIGWLQRITWMMWFWDEILYSEGS